MDTPDKWCPGDVYFIRDGSQGLIQASLAEAQAQGVAGIASINKLFSNRYGQVDADKHIVAVSLKMAKAQAGKLKSALKQYANTPKEYLLTKEEERWDRTVLLDNTRKQQDTANKNINRAGKDVDVDWSPCDLDAIPNTTEGNRTLRCKYAAYKALNFIYDQVAEKDFQQLDDALVSLVAFGLGVINRTSGGQQNIGDINPPFFKVMAAMDGSNTRPILFEGGKPIALWDYTDSGKTPPRIDIQDSVRFAGISVELGILVGEDKFHCVVAFRPNSPSTSQITLELQKADHVD